METGRMSLGTDRVRTSFNPSNDSVVDKIKWKTSELIDLCEAARNDIFVASGNTEATRLWSLAMTAYEEAAMWAVKATTTDK
jgi:hypothetical protein